MNAKRCAVCMQRKPQWHPPRVLVALCAVCYRRIYSGYDPPHPSEPTSQEVEERVADGYAHLPPWWTREEKDGAP